MKILQPKFWAQKNNLIALFLLPISLVLQILIKIKKAITFQNSFNIPVICIGNIYVGGTGKTPLSIKIANELLKLKKKPAIIRKSYDNHADEHRLIKDKINSLFLAKKRLTAINSAIKKNYDIAILDDGFQDFSIKKNLNILCFNSDQLIGNGMTIPSGPLRESLQAIKSAQFIIINGARNISFEKKIYSISKKVKIFYSKYLPLNIRK